MGEGREGGESGSERGTGIGRDREGMEATADTASAYLRIGDRVRLLADAIARGLAAGRAHEEEECGCPEHG